MRVLIICPYAPADNLGGGRKRLYYYIKALKQLEAEICVLCISPDKKDFDLIEKLKIDFDADIKAFLPKISENYKWIHKFRKLCTLYPDIALRKCSDFFLKQVLEKIEEEKIDIVHCEHSYFALPLLRITKQKKILAEQNAERILFLENQKNNIPGYRGGFLRKKIEYLKFINFEKKVYKAADKIILVSKEDFEKNKEYTDNKKIEIIPNFVSEEFFNNNKKSDIRKDSFFFFGDFNHPPNHQTAEFLLKNFPQIKAAIPSATLHIAGNNSTRFMKYSNDYIRIYDYVENIMDFIKDKEILISLIFSGSGTSFKVLETAAMKKIIIATEKAVRGLGFEQNKHYIFADKNNFIEKVIEYCANKEKYEIIKQNAFELVRQNYNENIFLDKYKNLIKGLIK